MIPGSFRDIEGAVLTSDTLTLESDWLPGNELRRLVDECSADFPATSVAASAPHRGLSPEVASALINGLTNLLAPFISKLVDRLFKKAPDAVVTVKDAAGANTAVITRDLSDDVVKKLIDDAVASGAHVVVISRGSGA